MYAACLLVPYAFVVLAAGVAGRPWALLGLLSAPLVVRPVRRVLGGETGRGLVAVLGATGQLVLVFGAFFAIGLAV
jgi:1,4-dihydroxy-2-naphthoate octaprenyltransferase